MEKINKTQKNNYIYLTKLLLTEPIKEFNKDYPNIEITLYQHLLLRHLVLDNHRHL